MSELRLGVEIGFKKITIALYENGVPRVMSSFPSIAACSIDRTEWHFGVDARNYKADTRYCFFPSVKDTLLAYGYGEQNPSIPFMLENLFARIRMIAQAERKQCIRGIVFVLSHNLDSIHVIRQAVVGAWQTIGVLDVLCISDPSAILLAFTVQTLDRQSFQTSATEPLFLLVCNADSDHFRMDVFAVISNNHVVKCQSSQHVLVNFFVEMRRRVADAIHQKLKNIGMSPLDDRSLAQLREDCWDQVALFNDHRTEKVTIRSPFHKDAVVYQRQAYYAEIEPVIEAARKYVVADLTRFGIMDANNGNINGKVELLVVGENSRLGLLRTALEGVTKSQVIAGAASYVDDAEAFGAAIASSLAGNSANIHRQHLLFRLEEGRVFDMEKIMKALPVQETSIVVQPARDIFISDRRDVSLSGYLYVGNPRALVDIASFRLVLCTPKIDDCKVHCIDLESSVNGQSVTFMRMLLGKDLRIQLKKLTRYRNGEYWIKSTCFSCG
ncbi:uncharacterized protein LOC129584196 [Paramacrobiotus metropolitanus]|uniref:uncharacterized protein LOC129584196 n=1 Tax=Paramacrobiotus metropolitanus TaxID=2943436 RepID=UPI0024459456|nr:uncharacterized protein LOC129584196 [Paramacrobiotus metropolitanus]